MIRWFKRKKKEDRETAPEDVAKKEIGEEEGPLEEETPFEEERPFETRERAEELEPETGEGPPEWVDEEESPEDKEDEAPEQDAPRKGFFKRFRQGLKGTHEKEETPGRGRRVQAGSGRGTRT